MIQVDAREAIRKLNDQYGYISNDKRKLAVARAINHTMAKAKTQVSREIRNIYTVDARTLNKALSQIKADRLTLTGMIKAKGKPLPLAVFRARQNKKGVSIEIKKGRRKLFPGVFLATMKSGHTDVMVRGKYSQGKIARRHKRIRPTGNDLPITAMAGVSIPSQLSNKIIIQSLNKSINEMFPQRLSHELKRVDMPV